MLGDKMPKKPNYTITHQDTKSDMTSKAAAKLYLEQKAVYNLI
jgi:hypothetical protein